VDDVIQECYAKLAELPSENQITYPKAYLYQVAKSLISEHIRHSAVIPIEALVEATQVSMLEEDFTPERIVSGRQELERLYRAISSLPSACRTVFVMRKFQDMPQKAIAAELRISENAVEKRMTRAIRQIVDYLQHDELERASPPVTKQRDPRGARKCVLD
jgi:RNA polymerase sigma factor (sigma-70 family)